VAWLVAQKRGRILPRGLDVTRASDNATIVRVARFHIEAFAQYCKSGVFISGVFMRTLLIAGLLFVTQIASATELAITFPANGAEIVLGKDPVTIKYQVAFDGDDDHLFIYLDGRKIQQLRQKPGHYSFTRPPLGNHEICLKVAYADHKLTGQQQCIKVTFFSPEHINYGNDYGG
jgi:hypothetical protein